MLDFEVSMTKSLKRKVHIVGITCNFHFFKYFLILLLRVLRISLIKTLYRFIHVFLLNSVGYNFILWIIFFSYMNNRNTYAIINLRFMNPYIFTTQHDRLGYSWSIMMKRIIENSYESIH